MKRILKYFLFLIVAFLLLVSFLIIALYFRYQSTVSVDAGQLEVGVKPGETGQYVNPFIGTGGFPTYTSGDNIPGATLPYGMVRLSPDTKFFLGENFFDEPTVSTAGYYYGDNRILGFSHTRLIGTGAYDGGHFRVIPGIGNKACDKYRAGKYHKFSHTYETAFPGYYAVQLKQPGVLAELTSTQRVGVHRYTFSKKEIPHILIDVSSSLGKGKSTDGMANISTNKNEITGEIKTYSSFSSRYGGQKVYFAADFSQPFLSYSIISDGENMGNQSESTGDKLLVDVSFDHNDTNCVVEIRLGISYVSTENARENLKAETEGKNFEQIVEEAKTSWEEKLNLVKIEGGTREQKQIFYTALYQSFQMPTLFNDVNGDYKGFDKKIHKAEGFRYFTDLSLWDTFRTTHPLFTLLDVKGQRDMLVSLVKMAKQGGVLPRWPAGYGYTGSMLGASADIVIAESYLKGIRDFDVETAYQTMKKTAQGINLPEKGFKPRGGIKEYLKYKYCPADLMSKAVSRTLEYAYADDAISKLAMELGYKEDAKLFAEHAQYYRNTWNPETQYFHPRNSSGEFVEKFKPLKLTYLDPHGKYTDDYVEGSALQWRWALFFDAEGLISLFKDKTHFVQELNAFFEKSNPKRGHWTPGSYYWHGNEPDIHAAYLFNYAGRPDLTQKWVRWILDNKYGANYDGVDGDNDAGTLSAWYVFSALGFYPVAGSDIYQLGAPLFKKAELQLGENRLTILAQNYSPKNKYVQKVWLNDVPLKRFWFTHNEIEGGGTLSFEMGENPPEEYSKLHN